MQTKPQLEEQKSKLDADIEALNQEMSGDEFQTLEIETQDLDRARLAHMQHLSGILQARIDGFA